ncbi:MAG: hypothetical protein POH28_08030 [Acidocella sp.]|nr:hypothetical protein [Acidocella sp.]
MKHMEPGKGRMQQIYPSMKLTVPETGCVQCGSLLEQPGHGLRNLSGRCFNCAGWIQDGDSPFDDQNE